MPLGNHKTGLERNIARGEYWVPGPNYIWSVDGPHEAGAVRNRDLCWG